MSSVRYSACTYSCAISPETRRIIVSRMDRHGVLKGSYVADEEGAHSWLGNHGLRRGKIKKLLSEVFRPMPAQHDGVGDASEHLSYP